MLLWLNDHLLPIAVLQNLQENPPRKVEVNVTAKGGLNLEWDVQQARMGVMSDVHKLLAIECYKCRLLHISKNVSRLTEV